MKYSGESTAQILYYWLPEVISLLIIIALPPLFDAYLVAGLQSTSAYGALGMATNFLHTLIKLSEAIPVAAMAVIGRYNGAKQYAQCGKELITTLWTTIFLGLFQLIVLCVLATNIYQWLGVPHKMAIIGAPYLRFRAIGVFLAFVLWAFMGFMRAIKNTRTPMFITLLGTVIYLFASYLFIPGNCGMPGLGIYGSAVAAIIQYGTMLVVAAWYVTKNPAYRKYMKEATLYLIQPGKIWHLMTLSIPIIIDKSSLSFSYVWLSKMIAPMGKYAIASFDIIKNLERTAIMPAAAFAQVITFLVSNRLGARDAKGAKTNITKVMLLTITIISMSLLILSIYAPYFIARISPSAEITQFATPILRLMSALVIFDFVQLILAGALRGAGSVRIVMWGRFLSCFFFFLPTSYLLSQITFSSDSLKFSCMYGLFYLNTALMGLIFLYFILKKNWYKKHL